MLEWCLFNLLVAGLDSYHLGENFPTAAYIMFYVQLIAVQSALLHKCFQIRLVSNCILDKNEIN